MQRSLGITFIYVTHDQEEALTMSDTIIVMKEGVIQQIGRRSTSTTSPERFVAGFIGESNIIPGQMARDFEWCCRATFRCVTNGSRTRRSTWSSAPRTSTSASRARTV